MTSPADDVPIGVPVYGIRFGDAMRRYVRGYVAFSGRASRSEYWWPQVVVGIWAMVVTLVAMVAGGALAAAAASGMSGSARDLGPLLLAVLAPAALAFVLVLPFALPNYASGARRLRDAGFSGLLMLLCLVPFGSIAVFVMTVLPTKVEADPWMHGQQQPYGSSPFGQQAPYGTGSYGSQP